MKFQCRIGIISPQYYIPIRLDLGKDGRALFIKITTQKGIVLKYMRGALILRNRPPESDMCEP
ncbi:hypothetical protein GCM10007207_29240 [Asaia siamensis]|uniref:Uncharacterized protein n=1 Tax=Asaia siamensis TaxID=110479 RepID=A0ABQ1MSA1_9PROT|nr:hypothetical protein AA0323_1670 [Asaia siamensis NRIC 0323]GGC42090.1 hypothetical protein GCM10007207_29240 [Asaia siamensis]